VYGDGRRHGIRLHYVVEKSPLGTAGAMKNAEKWVKGHTTVVLNGDILTNLDLSAMIVFHRRLKSVATLGLVAVEDPSPFGLVLLDSRNRVTKFLEKPTPEEAVADTINGGVYIFEPEVFDAIPAGVPYSAERALFPQLLKMQTPFHGFVQKCYWQDIGTPEKYLTSQWDVLKGAFVIPLKLKKGPRGSFLGKGVKVARGAVVLGPSLLMDGCVLEEGAEVQPLTVLGPKCRIGRNAVVSKSVLWEGVQVGEGVHLEQVMAGRRCRIGASSRVPPGSVLGDGTKV
jgi:NDP-sugar pyrophosphorylase family protein